MRIIESVKLSEALSSNNTYSSSASTNVYDISLLIISVNENMTSDIPINEMQMKFRLDLQWSYNINLQQPTNEPYKIIPLPKQLIQSPSNWINPQQSGNLWYDSYRL